VSTVSVGEYMAPLLTLCIPDRGTAAVILGAFLPLGA
jgi:TctA family transporter